MPELEALISLLQDDSRTVLDAVQTRLIELRAASRERVLEAAETGSPLVRVRAREVLSLMDRSDVFERLFEYAEDGAPELERGALLLSAVQTPSLDVDALVARLDGFAEDVRPRLEALEPGRELLETFLSYVHDELGFGGDTDDFYAFENNFLHLVVERRRGIPITLTAVYLLLGRRLGLDIEVVGAPYRALASYSAPEYSTYIDAFAGGELCTRRECLDFLRRHGFVAGNGDRFLRVLTDSEILERMTQNIIRFCDGHGRDAEGRSFRRFARTLTEQRDGAGLAHDASG